MNEIERQTNWRVIKKYFFYGTFFLNAGISGTTMKPTLLQKILKEVTYSSIF